MLCSLPPSNPPRESRLDWMELVGPTDVIFTLLVCEMIRRFVLRRIKRGGDDEEIKGTGQFQLAAAHIEKMEFNLKHRGGRSNSERQNR